MIDIFIQLTYSKTIMMMFSKLDIWQKRQKLLWPLSAFIIIWYIAFLNEGTWTIDKERKLVSGKLLFRSQERTKLYGTILTTTTTMLRKKLTAFPRVFTNTHFSLRIQSINRVTNLSKIHESLLLTFCSISIDPSSNILKSYFFLFICNNVYFCRLKYQKIIFHRNSLPSKIIFDDICIGNSLQIM